MKLSHEALCLIYGIFFSLCFHLTSEEFRSCPVGFDLAYDERQNEYICYKLKGPQPFRDKYVDCEENIYSLDLHFRLNITRHGTGTFWIDYSSLYPGGPYVNWENTKDSVMNNIGECYDLSHNNKKSCLVVTNMDILTAVECNEMHYRYCFINQNNDSKPHRKFPKKSTKNMCRLTINSTSNVTWIQAKSLCEDKGMSQIDKELSYRNITWEAEVLMNQVLHNLRQLTANEEDPIVIDDLLSVFDQVNCLLDLKLDLGFSGELARLLHEIGPRVDLPATGTAKITRHNIGLEMSLQSPVMFIWGLIVHRHYRFTENSFEYIYSSNLSSTFHQNTTDAVVTIPESIIWSFNRWNFLAFWDDTFFHDPRGMYTVNSRIISVNVDPLLDLEGTRINIYLRPLVSEEGNVRRTCVHWHFSDDVSGYWTEDACTLIKSDDPELLDTCECNLRFTYYAEALTSLTVEELITQLLNDLRLLLDGQVDPHISDIDHIFYWLNDLLVVDHDAVFPVELVRLLQELGPRVDISPNSTSAIVRNSTALLVFVQRDVCGISVARSDDHNFTEHTFNFIPGALKGIEINMLDANAYDAVLILPEFVWSYSPGVSFMVFLDDRVFNDSLGFYPIISRVLSFNVTFFEEFENETKDLEIDLHLRPLITERDFQSRRTCVRWIFSDDGNGFWSEEGCKLITYDDPELLDTCKCKLFTTYYAMALLSLPVTTTDSTNIDSTTDTTLTPEEQIQEVLEDLKQLLNQTTPISVDDISPVFDQVDNLLNLDQGIDIPGQMLQMLEELGTRVDLDGSLTSAVVRNSIGLLMADVTEDNPVQGLVVASGDTDAFTQDTFGFLMGEPESSLLNVNVSEAVVKLPLSVTRHPRRISFVVYRYGYAFSDDREIFAINSRILSISVENHTQFERGEVVDIHLRPIIPEPNRDERRVCVYWHFLEDQTGYWSQDGCMFIRTRNPSSLDICRCNHLTHFAEILVPRPVFSKRSEDALEIISVVGCLLSIFGIVIIILTAVLFRSWRKNFRNQVWLQLCIALFLMSLCNLKVVFRKYDDCSIACILTGISLHYSLLASFCWMLVVAVKSYNDLVLVFIRHVPRKRLIASGFSWGVPVVIIGILLAVNPQAYSGHFEEMNPSSKFCYPSGNGLWVTVYTPIAVILLANWTIFVLIVRQIGFTPRGPHPQKPGDIREALACIRLSIVLIFLFGLPWLFGLFAFNIIAAYLFTFTATTQGFVLFLLIVCGNTQTRSLWLSKLKRKEHKSYTVTSDY